MDFRTNDTRAASATCAAGPPSTAALYGCSARNRTAPSWNGESRSSARELHRDDPRDRTDDHLGDSPLRRVLELFDPRYPAVYRDLALHPGAAEQLLDLPVDVFVASGQQVYNVAAADHADDASIVHDRNALDSRRVHQLDRIAEVAVTCHGHRQLRHHVLDTARIFTHPFVQDHVGSCVVAHRVAKKVCLVDDSHQVAAAVDDRK